MNEFMKRWSEEPRYRTKVKLSLYTIFVVLVAIFAISTRNSIPADKLKEENDGINSMNKDNTINSKIEVPEEYDYKINININNNTYQYIGSKTNNREIITKDVNGAVTNYIYENNNYYEDVNGNYILTSRENVFDIVKYNYIKIETLNEFLAKAIKIENQYIIYVKDIILGNDSEQYITINYEENKITVDYANLMKCFDKTIENYTVIIEIKENE